MIEQVVCPVLVAREEELSTLEDALLGAARGEGRIVVVAGDAGLGKTRLATEVRRRAEAIGSTVLWGGCAEADLQLPYLPFLEAIGNHLVRADVATLGARLGPARRELALLFPQLTGEIAVDPGGDATQAKLRLFEAILTLLRAVADDGSLLLVVEDIHWADASTRELLDYMTRRLRTSRILVLATYRSDEMHRRHPLLPTVQSWRRSGTATVVELQPLTPEGVGSAVRAIFDVAEVSTEFTQFLRARTEGNPFVLEEMLKSAIDRGDIFRDAQGDWDRKAVDELRLPETVRDTILMRVERLERDHARVLSSAAVVGARFDYATLVAVSGLDQATVEAALAATVQLQLVVEDLERHHGYRFRHALTQEAVYEDLLLPVRERLHGLAADALAADPHASAVDRARHLLAAGRFDEAMPACTLAAREAIGCYALVDAIRLCARALTHAHGPSDRGSLHGLLGEAHFELNEADKAVPYLEQAVTSLEEASAVSETARLRLILGRAQWRLGRALDARAEYEHVREALEPEGPSEDLAQAYVLLAALEIFEKRGAAAQVLAERAIAVAEAAGADRPRVFAYNYLGCALCFQDDYEEGLRVLDRSWREALALGLDTVAAVGLNNALECRVAPLRFAEGAELVERLRGLRAGEAAVFADTWAAVLQMNSGSLERALELARRAQSGAGGVTLQRETAEWVMTRALVELERVGEVPPLPALEPTRERQDILNGGYQSMSVHLATGDTAAAATAARLIAAGFSGTSQELEGGDMAVRALIADGAVEEAASLVAFARDHVGHGQRTFLDRMEGRLALAQGAPERAVRPLQGAAAALEAARYGLEEGWTRVLLADGLRGTGDEEASALELRRALRVALRMGARALERAARERGAVEEVPTPAERAEVVPPAAPSEPPGERYVTVMFADVRGYTAMSAGQPPAELLDRITAFQRWATQEVQRHRGVVDKFAGDAVMATFNVTSASVDHTLQAVQAGFALRDKAALLGLPIGIGIAVGPAVVGRLTDGANLSVIGEATNLAARLQAQAAAGEAVLSAEAYRRVRTWLAAQDATVETRTVELKGLPEPVEVHRVR